MLLFQNQGRKINDMSKDKNKSRMENKWQKLWEKEKIYEPNLSASRRSAKKPFYNLMMFPYPSAEGLHVGNMYAFVGSDIYGRFKRMQGYDVFEPIGLDGFGIHSENYALKIGTHPLVQAKISEKRFYKQLKIIGNGFAWKNHLETYDHQYYRWTQWIFIQLFKNGLAYRKKSSVNWCPSCKTVLADEQVIGGKCERCSTEVVKKELEQWFFKITRYAERLLKNLGVIDWSEKVKIAQKNWIGKSEGALLKFSISLPGRPAGNSQFKPSGDLPRAKTINVFTTRPDTLFGATYMVLSPEHKLLENNELGIKNYEEVKKYIDKAKRKSDLDRIELAKEKTGVELKGIKAINPANKKEIPIFVADYVLSSYGTGAIMAVPAHDERDFEFAKKYKLPIQKVIWPLVVSNPLGSGRGTFEYTAIKSECWTGEGELVNSSRFNGMPSEKAKWEITKFVAGKKQTQYRLRDWLISRQRYWGPPIPIIYCRKCWEIRNSKSAVAEGKSPEGLILNKSKTQNLKLHKGIDYAIFDGKEYIIHPVPEKNLPVKLPYVKDFRPKGKGQSPLATVKSFYEVKCPACGLKARRETDVSDTFLDSAWYYLGYLILGNKKSKIENWKLFLPSANPRRVQIENSPFSNSIIRKWCPVDMYIGGAEHAVLHLLYSRFLTMALCDIGVLKFSAKGARLPDGQGSASGGEEPFTKFRAHGLLIKEGAKMSKSKGNVLNPDDYIKKFGADVFRMYLMFLSPFEQGGDFRDAGILGISRFLEKVWKLFQKSEILNQKFGTNSKLKTQNLELEQLLHRTIKKVTEDIENLRYNTAISALMILFNEIEKNKDSLFIIHYSLFLKLLAPFAPHIAEEIWRNVLGNKKSIHTESWPVYDKKLIQKDEFELIIQINGKVRDKILTSTGTSQKEAEKLAFSREKIKIWLESRRVEKIIFVPNRLINIVPYP